MEQLAFDFDRLNMFKSEDEIFADIVSKLTPEDKATLNKTSEDDLIMFHHGYGTWIRNNYLLWDPKNPYTDKESSLGDDFPDQMSQRIIERVWSHVTGKAKMFDVEVIEHDGSYRVVKVSRATGKEINEENPETDIRILKFPIPL